MDVLLSVDDCVMVLLQGSIAGRAWMFGRAASLRTRADQLDRSLPARYATFVAGSTIAVSIRVCLYLHTGGNGSSQILTMPPTVVRRLARCRS
jgi:hypothetical protein